MFSESYRNRRLLLTGHTGFKGSWLALWLREMGAEVTGFALAPEATPSHWDLLKIDMPEYRDDIRNAEAVSEAVKKTNPDIIFHLAAQSLVRRSYRAPVESWETNVMGSVNLLEACRYAPNLKAIVVVTTDKCYQNKESEKGYTEDDKLGGYDPYSASKASAELVAASYRDSFFKGTPLIATARAGNVIGGGDWAAERLIPDLARAQEKNDLLIVRSPNSVRPWQHVLEPLSGYLQLGKELLDGQKGFEGAWNFGPEGAGSLSVSDLLKILGNDWPGVSWKAVPDTDMHETALLRLDSSKARTKLSWVPVLSVDEQIRMTAEWYGAYYDGGKILSREQLKSYQDTAKKSGASWV